MCKYIVPFRLSYESMRMHVDVVYLTLSSYAVVLMLNPERGSIEEKSS